MNKKLIWIPVGVAVLILLIYEIAKPKSEYGSNFTMKCTTIKGPNAPLKNVVLYFDNSGSMKGYTDFIGYPDAKKSIVSSTVNGLTNLSVSNLRIECGTTVIDDILQYQEKLTTGTLLNGAITELDKMLRNASEQVSDTSISIIVTDMVLSYGKGELVSKKDNWLNKHNLSDLGSSVYNTVKKIKEEKDAHFLILQYLSDYNGKYYYNCTENLIMPKNLKYDSLMHNRPYYIVVIGKKEALKPIINKECFTGYANMYTSFGLDETDYTEQPFTADKPHTGGWSLGNKNDKAGCLVADNKQNGTTFAISFDTFEIPKYIDANYKVGSYSENIEMVEYRSNKEFTVKLKPCTTSKDTVKAAWFTLESPAGNNWAAKCSIENDNDVEIKSLKDMESKTWGLNYVIDNIDKAFFPKERPDDRVATINFNIVYHN